MRPSNLVETGWHSMSYHRGTYGQTEVLAVVYGPYESRNSSKSNMSKSLIEVVISDLTISADHSTSEKTLSDLFSAVIKTQKYPYLTIMICIQLFSKDENFLSACINSAFQALKGTNLDLNFGLIAADYKVNEAIVSLAIVPKTDEILLSLCDRPIEFSVFKQLVNNLSGV